MNSITILGGGPSQYKCPKSFDDGEIWGINSLGVSAEDVKIDRMFILHDILTEVLLQDHSIIGKLNTMGVPVYTAGPAPVFENNIQYPVAEVVAHFKVGFFLNTMAYMLAFAIMQKPKLIYLYGVDMRPDSGYEWHKEERGCIEFWIGVALGNGIKTIVQPEAYLLKRTMVSNWYAFNPIRTTEGALQFMQRSNRGKYNNYIIFPCDEDGKPLDDAVLITPKGPRKIGMAEDIEKKNKTYKTLHNPAGDNDGE